MKPDTNIKGHRGNAGVGVKMSIDESATAHIMDVLTKLYANPLQAVIREYSTNASDSHVQAGQDAPIEVQLPTPVNPVLTIVDRGIGLDEADIENIYSRYGTSTKRDSNDAVGMLGLGCKSALSYTDQFTLVGTKGGVRTTVLISRDEDGAGSMTVVDVQNTAASDGVTIQVPIRRDDVATAQLEAARFFMFWQPGSVLVDGKEPDRVDGMWLDEQTLLTDDEAIGYDLVVMGNVAYPLVEGEDPLYTSGTPGHTRRYVNGRYIYGQAYHAVAFVPIGTVNFAPSRESLMNTKRTRATLAKVREHIASCLEDRVRKDIADAPTAKEAQERLQRGKDLVPRNVDLTGALWKGRPVLLSLNRTRPPAKPDSSGYVPNWGSPDDWAVEDALKYSYLFLHNGRGHRKSGERGGHFDLRRFSNMHIVEGFDGKHWTNVKRAKLELYMTKKGHVDAYGNLPSVMAVDKLTPDERFWLDGWKIHKWADIAAIELPKADTGNGVKRISGSYDVLWEGNRKEGVPAAEIAKASVALYWIHGNYWNAAHHKAIKSKAVDPTQCIVVCLGANRIDKFCRDFPKAVKLDDAAREAAERWWKLQDKDTLKAYTIQRKCSVEALQKLDADALLDPDLTELARLVKVNTSPFTQALDKHRRWLTFEVDDHAEEWAEGILARYPLLTQVGHFYRDSNVFKHLTIYLNAAYNAEKGAA